MLLRSYHSEDFEAKTLVKDLINSIEQDLASNVNNEPLKGLILFSGTAQDHQGVVSLLHEKYPQIAIAGCSSNAEYTATGGLLTDSIAAMAFFGNDCEMKSGMIDGTSTDRFGENCKREIEQINNSFTNKKTADVCFLFSESLKMDGAAVLNQFKKNLPNTLIYGGLAGDDWKFIQTYQFSNGSVKSNSVAFLLIQCKTPPIHSLALGWNALGESGVANRVEGNHVFEIDNKPAKQFYDKFLGEHNFAPGENPIAVFVGDDFYLRAPYAYDPDGSIYFTGTVEQGRSIKIANASIEDILSSNTRAINDIKSKLKGDPQGIILISCAARKQIVGTRVKEEGEMVKNAFPNIPLICFYAYGEISPFANNTEAHFHNQTLTCIVFR